jgi:hypothetical protein
MRLAKSSLVLEKTVPSCPAFGFSARFGRGEPCSEVCAGWRLEAVGLPREPRDRYTQRPVQKLQVFPVGQPVSAQAGNMVQA